MRFRLACTMALLTACSSELAPNLDAGTVATPVAVPSPSPTPVEGFLRINETYYYHLGASAFDPDADRNGVLDGSDQFVEIVNAGGTDVPLAGVSLYDAHLAAPRHTFGNVMLPPGRAILVFGQGAPIVNDATFCQVWRVERLASGTFGFDLIDSLRIAIGTTTLASVSWSDGGDDVDAIAGQSITLPDEVGDRHIDHPVVLDADSIERTFSPGCKADGVTPFR